MNSTSEVPESQIKAWNPDKAYRTVSLLEQALCIARKNCIGCLILLPPLQKSRVLKQTKSSVKVGMEIPSTSTGQGQSGNPLYNIPHFGEWNLVGQAKKLGILQKHSWITITHILQMLAVYYICSLSLYTHTHRDTFFSVPFKSKLYTRWQFTPKYLGHYLLKSQEFFHIKAEYYQNQEITIDTILPNPQTLFRFSLRP